MAQVMTFIKSHTLALACAVVALLGLIAYFIYPIPGMFADLQAEVSKSEETHKNLVAIRDEPRTLPLTKIDGQPEPLPYPFPVRTVIKEGQDALARLKTQATEALNEAVRLNQRPLLVQGSLPQPTSLARQQFSDAYRIVTAQIGDDASKGIIHTVLHGAVPPNETELKEQGDRRANEMYSTMLQTGPDGKPVNQATVDAEIARMRAALPMQLRVARAKSSTIYVSPAAVDVHPFVKLADLPDAVTIFNAQYSLWLQTTAMEALADANKSATNVLDAPVKHLLLLRVPMEAAAVPSGGGGVGFGAPAEAAPPAELTPDPAATINPDYSANGGPLGYSHNSLFDPVQITMIVRMDVRQMPQVLETLSRGRLLKIRNVNFRTVDAGRALQEGYIYDQTGKTPMVEVTIDCDILMLRPWLVPLMPAPVKAYFAQRSNPTPAG